jgi:hypothetical protein
MRFWERPLLACWSVAIHRLCSLPLPICRFEHTSKIMSKIKKMNFRIRHKFGNRGSAQSDDSSISCCQTRGVSPILQAIESKFFALSAYLKPFPMSWRLGVMPSDWRWEKCSKSAPSAATSITMTPRWNPLKRNPMPGAAPFAAPRKVPSRCSPSTSITATVTDDKTIGSRGRWDRIGT